MAILRAERKGMCNDKFITEGIVELVSDLAAMADATADNSLLLNGSKVNPVAQGSLILCLEDKKIYCKKSDGTWGDAQ